MSCPGSGVRSGRRLVGMAVLLTAIAGTRSMTVTPAARAESGVAGVIVDAEGGEPIAGALVAALGANTTSLEQAETTNAGGDGRFELAASRSATHLLAVASGRQPTRIEIPTEAEARRGMRIALPRGGVILRGKITTPEGEPIEGAMVRDGVAFAESDGEGRYELTVTRLLNTSTRLLGQPRDAVRPDVTHRDYVGMRGFSVPIDLISGVATKDVTLSRGGGVFGVVTAKESGEPLRGVRVTTGESRFTAQLQPSDRTNSDGEFRLTGVPSGAQVVNAFSDQWAPSMDKVSVGVGKEVEVDFELEAGESVTGTVVDGEGKPVEDVRLVTDTWEGVRMFERSANTASDGRFELAHMPSTPVELSIFKRGYSSERSLKVTGGDRDVEVVLYGESFIRGRVVDAASGEPIRDFEVVQGLRFHTNPRIYWQDDRGEKFSDAEGRFELRVSELSNYDVTVKVRAEGYRPERLDEALGEGQFVKRGTNLDHLEFSMRPSSVFQGRVVNGEGQPVGGALVKLFNEEQTLYLSNYYGNQSHGVETVTDSEGGFRMTGMEDGDYRIYVSKETVGVRFLDEMTIAGEGAPRDIELEPYGALEGYVYQGEAAVADAVVTASTHESAIPHLTVNVRTKTNADGWFRFDQLPANQYVCIHYISSDHSSANVYARREHVVVHPGEATFCVLGGDGGATVRGTITDGGSNPLAELTVFLSVRGGGRTKAFGTLTGDDGSYALHDVPPGTYQLSARSAMRRGGTPTSYRGELEVAAAGEVVHDITITTPGPLSVGGVLPALELRRLDDTETTLADYAEERFLVLRYSSRQPEQSPCAAWIGEHAEAIREQGVRILMVVPYYDAEKAQEQLAELGLGDDLVMAKTRWYRGWSERFARESPEPAILIDGEGTVLATCREYVELETQLGEVE